MGGVAATALRNGQILNLAAAGLTEVSRTAGAVAGQTVRQVTDRGGQALEVVTDAANRIVSWRRVPRAPAGTQQQPR